MKHFGFFAEFGEISWSDGSIHGYIAATPQRDEDQIFEYLSHGIPFMIVPAVFSDVLDPSGSAMCSAHILTDGEWVWSESLAYFVRRYHLRVPDEFVAHMRSQSWTPPFIEQSALDRLFLTLEAANDLP